MSGYWRRQKVDLVWSTKLISRNGLTYQQLDKIHPKLGRIILIDRPDLHSSYEKKKLYLVTYMGKEVYMTCANANQYYKSACFHWKANPIDVKVYLIENSTPKDWYHPREVKTRLTSQ